MKKVLSIFWKETALQSYLGDEFEIFKDYNNISDYGKWEKDNYVLVRTESDERIAEKYAIAVSELKGKVSSWQTKLLEIREKRARPGLDDKVLTSWNALMLKGYIDAYRVFDEPKFLSIAERNASFIEKNMLRKEGGLNRNFKNGKSNISAYLEDYSTFIDTLILLYEVSQDEKWLILAKELTDYTLIHFYDNNSGMFYFTSDLDES